MNAIVGIGVLGTFLHSKGVPRLVKAPLVASISFMEKAVKRVDAIMSTPNLKTALKDGKETFTTFTLSKLSFYHNRLPKSINWPDSH